MIYLHENGVTVVATDEAKRGKVYELNGEEYFLFLLAMLEVL